MAAKRNTGRGQSHEPGAHPHTHRAGSSLDLGEDFAFCGENGDRHDIHPFNYAGKVIMPENKSVISWGLHPMVETARSASESRFLRLCGLSAFRLVIRLSAVQSAGRSRAPVSFVGVIISF